MKSGALVGVAAALLLGASAARADVEISKKPTSNMTCEAGVCTATAQKAVLNVGDLQTMLASGDVAVKTGTVANDIDIDQPLSWTDASRLTLDAQQSVTVKKYVTVAGQGALTVSTNDTGATKAKSKTGEFIIVPEHGSVQFWDLSSSLIIDGNSYILVNDIKTLATEIAANPSGFYALAKPYDASGDGTYTASPVDSLLEGTFEGLGNSVSSVSITSDLQAAYIGFFRGVDTPAVVRDFRIDKALLHVRAANGVGVLASGNFGQVVRCRVKGTISFEQSIEIGGLVGENDGLIVDSAAEMRVVGSGQGKTVGALVGSNYTPGYVTSSYALGSVALRKSSFSNVGGLIGENDSAVQNSFSRTNVTDGKQNNESYYGGFVGVNDVRASIEGSYAAGQTAINSGDHAGGLIGNDASEPGSISKAYWDLDMGISDPGRGAGNISNDPGITGLTTKQFQKGLPKGFDPEIWGSNPNINHGFPYLLSNITN